MKFLNDLIEKVKIFLKVGFIKEVKLSPNFPIVTIEGTKTTLMINTTRKKAVSIYKLYSK